MTLVSRAKLILYISSFLILITSACAGKKDLTAEEILKQYIRKNSDLKYAHFEMEIEILLPGSNVTMAAEGVLEQPDKIYMSLITHNQKVEVLSLSQTEKYGRVVGEEQWTALQVDPSSQFTTSPDAFEFLGFTDFYTNTVRKEDERIGGVDCYHLTASYDPRRVFEITTPAPNPEYKKELLVAVSQPVVVNLWVAKSDMLVRKVEMIIYIKTQGINAQDHITMTLSKINEPVTIRTLASDEIKPTESP